MNASKYDPQLLERHLQGTATTGSKSGRTEFERDRDRILYSSAFRALAAKTQVVSATELGYMHNRLTHSLKVAQVGRAIASRLQDAGAELDPALVEAACLAHDIGHPPFGHAGEEALNLAVERHRRKALGLGPDDALEVALDGFEGNAQNLRVLTRLATHRLWEAPGLHLTRATLISATKYPWERGLQGKEARKWGAYEGDSAALQWAVEGRPGSATRPIEADLMDWADDITYAVHDVEDWFRLGLIPLEKLFVFRLPPQHEAAGRDQHPELVRFLDWVFKKWLKEGKYPGVDRESAVVQMHYLADKISVVDAFHGSKGCKGRLQATVTDLISFFADETTFEGRAIGYEGKLHVPDDRRLVCDLLQELVWFYVIERPGLAAQQHGQAKIIENLVDWVMEDHGRLLPDDRKAEYDEHHDLTRAVADHVASLTEPMAIKLHGKLSGADLGAITDTV